MYEAVRARPAGPTTVARLAATAADYGFTGVVLTNPPGARPAYDPAAIRAAYDVDVVDGLALEPEAPDQASGLVGRYRPETTVLCLRGTTERLRAYAVRQERLDVLFAPGPGLSHVDVKTAADHGVRIAIDLGSVLRSVGDRRTAALAELRKRRELIEAYDVPFVVTAGGASHLELRAPRELMAVANTVGLDRGAVETGLSEWRRLAERNRERQSAAYVSPGVSRSEEP